MNRYNVIISAPYPLGATEVLYRALQKLGFQYTPIKICRGCHWGNVWFLGDDMERAQEFAGDEGMFLVVTCGREFLLSPSGPPANEAHWIFSIRPHRNV